MPPVLRVSRALLILVLTLLLIRCGKSEERSPAPVLDGAWKMKELFIDGKIERSQASALKFEATFYYEAKAGSGWRGKAEFRRDGDSAILIKDGDREIRIEILSLTGQELTLQFKDEKGKLNKEVYYRMSDAEASAFVGGT